MRRAGPGERRGGGGGGAGPGKDIRLAGGGGPAATDTLGPSRTWGQRRDGPPDRKRAGRVTTRRSPACAGPGAGAVVERRSGSRPGSLPGTVRTRPRPVSHSGGRRGDDLAGVVADAPVAEIQPGTQGPIRAIMAEALPRRGAVGADEVVECRPAPSPAREPSSTQGGVEAVAVRTWHPTAPVLLGR